MRDPKAERRLGRLRAARDEYLRLMTPSARQTYEQQVRPSIMNGSPCQLLGDLWSVDYLSPTWGQALIEQESLLDAKHGLDPALKP